MFTIIKIIVSAAIIGIITEISRRSPSYGGIIAALPIVSMLSMVWLYIQGETKETLSHFAFSVASGLPPQSLCWSLSASPFVIHCLSLPHQDLD